MRRARFVGGAALAALVLASCGGGGGGGSSRTPKPPALTLSACTVQKLPARCGTWTVPENPARPDGRRISLRVVVLPARSAEHQPDPLFYLAGYGGAASDSVAWAAGTFARLNETRDIVFVDQRGTGASNRMECPGMMVLRNPQADPATVEKLTRDCLASATAKGDPRYYTTPLAVDDFDAVRGALGYDRIDIYGGSYGVSSGLAYIQRHGAHVRAALFDSGSLLDIRLWELGARSGPQAVDAVLQRCEADRACAAAYPDVRQELATVLQRLAAAPVTVQLDAGTSLVLDPATLLGGLVEQELSSVQQTASLPRAVHMADAGDWVALLHSTMAPQASASEVPDTRFTLVSSWTIACSDEWARMDADRVAVVGGNSPLTPVIVAGANIRTAVCALWPKASGSSGAVRTQAPVVFLNGTADSADPPDNVAGAAATMPNSLVVPVPAYTHGVISNDASNLIASEANTFLQLGVPSALKDWPAALSPYYPPFVTG